MSKRDQYLMKLRSDFKSVRSNLMNRDPPPSLDVCFRELFREERRLFTQNAFKQESIHTVAFAAQGKRKDRDMSTTQCYSCKEYGHIVVRSSAVIVSSTGILSKSVPHVLKTIR